MLILFSLENLTSLELRENLIRTLPESLPNLTKLERLDLGDNEIEELVREIDDCFSNVCTCSSKVALSLPQPPHIGSLPSLTELWLDHNQLAHLPPEIGNLSALTCLDISENHLEDIPYEIEGLYNLTDLHLSQNSIESLPDTVGKLRKLTIFKIDQNRLTSLNANIGYCVSLQELVLTENYITSLPSTIGELTNLTNLNIDRNKLEYLPPEIGNLVNLGVLSLRENQLHILPHEIGTCAELHVLDVSGNRLPHLPFTLTNLNLKALWLAENQAKPMLNFQTDYDENTGEQVLTCFLLPQMEYQPDDENPGERPKRPALTLFLNFLLSIDLFSALVLRSFLSIACVRRSPSPSLSRFFISLAFIFPFVSIASSSYRTNLSRSSHFQQELQLLQQQQGDWRMNSVDLSLGASGQYHPDDVYRNNHGGADDDDFDEEDWMNRKSVIKFENVEGDDDDDEELDREVSSNVLRDGRSGGDTILQTVLPRARVCVYWGESASFPPPLSIL